MSKLHQIRNYLTYKTKAVNGHGVHSPFVFDLLTNVIYNQHSFYIFDKIEALRAELLQNQREIKHTDLGAGSKVNSREHLSIKQVARNAAKVTIAKKHEKNDANGCFFGYVTKIIAI